MDHKYPIPGDLLRAGPRRIGNGVASGGVEAVCDVGRLLVTTAHADGVFGALHGTANLGDLARQHAAGDRLAIELELRPRFGGTDRGLLVRGKELFVTHATRQRGDSSQHRQGQRQTFHEDALRVIPPVGSASGV